MNKNFIYIPLLIATILFYVNLTCSKDEKSYNYNSGYLVKLLKQENYNRKFGNDSLNLIIKLNISNEIYIPFFCKFDEDGNIYILDRSTFYIHKFIPNKSGANYSHQSFGKGKGQGPGEFSDPRDFEIDEDKLYIVDPSNGCIEVYSSKALNLKRITLSNHLTPGKIIVLNNTFIIEPYTYTGGDLFYLYDSSGNLLSSFGSYIDKANIYNGVYHDNDLLKISENSFYYLPRYLGFVARYKDNNLLYARATIDGLNRPEAMNNKEVMEGVFVYKIKKTIYTAASSACNSKYLIVKAIDVKKKKIFYDVYDVENFDYLKSIRNLPPLNSFDINEELFAGINDTCLFIWSLKNLKNKNN